MAPSPCPALSCEVSCQPAWAARASASGAGGSRVAFATSVVLEVVEAEGWAEAAACGLFAAKEPLFLRDSAARESEVTRPVGSLRVAVGSVTCVGLSAGFPRHYAWGARRDGPLFRWSATWLMCGVLF